MGIPRITLLSSPGTVNFIVSNCGGPSVPNVNNLTINLNPPLELPIDVLLPIRMYYEVCYINGEFALFRGVDANNTNTLCDDTDGEKTVGKELVIEGVENMQVRYGIDTDRDNIANRYSVTPPLSALPQQCGNNTTNRPIVVSVRITLLMRTVGRRPDLDKATNKPFQLDPEPAIGEYNPNSNLLESGYRHRLFTSTIQIRNCFR
jgi:type IV pilus assembly protein PilW